MVVFDKSEEWQRQSSLLLQARPTTTRITVKYNIPNLASPRYQKAKKRKLDGGESEKDAAATPAVPKAVLTLKTFDPESGVCLLLKTDRAAEVGRLINGLGKLGRHMAALPQKTEDTIMEDAPVAEPLGQAEQGHITGGNGVPLDTKALPNTGGGQQKKKKKGKK